MPHLHPLCIGIYTCFTAGRATVLSNGNDHSLRATLVHLFFVAVLGNCRAAAGCWSWLWRVPLPGLAEMKGHREVANSFKKRRVPGNDQRIGTNFFAQFGNDTCALSHCGFFGNHIHGFMRVVANQINPTPKP